ncbi:uncharacterized protein LOC134271415, partial [Saccostrea cucullata]|uniref:uncharacterized protein LOC134271415 n=1 Tax=Saccostrea cuccullata TaxID=36930 RepID=UPI002ED2C641
FTLRPVKVEDIFTKFGFLTPEPKNQDKNVFVPAEVNQTFETIKSGFPSDNLVACVSKEEVWITGKDKIMKRFDSQNTLLETVDTLTGNWPCDVCLTKHGDLLYSDWNDRSVNLVNGGQIKRTVALDGWKPSGICPSCVGELLVCMQSHNVHESKVVRFSKSVVIQEIQYGSNGKPLYSSGGYTMFIAENRNLDVCVSDFRARQVIVVSQWGKLRFKYDGKISSERAFSPYAIDTDKMSRIFIVDSGSRCIHVIDADGHFLAFIPACGNIEPLGLSMKDGVMFVGSGNSDIVNCMKYNNYI